MDTNLLRSWLGLPPGPWPPDDRTLLGLAESADASDAERRALERMARLRPHQLMNPELVTEGMNRLAQALLSVGSARSNAQPAPALVVEKAAPSPAAKRDEKFFPEVDLQAEVVDAAQMQPVLEAEAVDIPEGEKVETTRSTKPTREGGNKQSATLFEEVAPPPLEIVRIGHTREDRRTIYREIAVLRGLTRAWDRLQPFVADPSESLRTPGQVFEFLDSLQNLRGLPSYSGREKKFLTKHAPRCMAIFRQSLVLPVFRILDPMQRRMVAREWATVRAHLESRNESLRSSVSRAAKRDRETRPTEAVVAWFGRNPEWVLVTASIMAIGVAVIRVASR